MKLIVGKQDNPVIVLNSVFAKSLKSSGIMVKIEFIVKSLVPTHKSAVPDARNCALYDTHL